MKKIFISSDHAGYNLKQQIIRKFSKKYKLQDLGTNNPTKSVNYPDYAHKLCKKVSKNSSNELNSAIAAINLIDQSQIASKRCISFPTNTRNEAVKVVLLQYSLCFVVCFKDLSNAVAVVGVSDPVVLNVKRLFCRTELDHTNSTNFFSHPTRAKLHFKY